MNERISIAGLRTTAQERAAQARGLSLGADTVLALVEAVEAINLGSVQEGYCLLCEFDIGNHGIAYGGIPCPLARFDFSAATE